MLRHSLALLLSIATASGLVACSSGTYPTTGSSGSPSTVGSGSSSTDPAGDGDGTPAKSGSTKSALGPSCTAYVACCEQVAATAPQLAASCDSVKSQIEMAQANGVSTSSYESACKSGITSYQSAGYCK